MESCSSIHLDLFNAYYLPRSLVSGVDVQVTQLCIYMYTDIICNTLHVNIGKS